MASCLRCCPADAVDDFRSRTSSFYLLLLKNILFKKSISGIPIFGKNPSGKIISQILSMSGAGKLSLFKFFSRGRGRKKTFLDAVFLRLHFLFDAMQANIIIGSIQQTPMPLWPKKSRRLLMRVLIIGSNRIEDCNEPTETP